MLILLASVPLPRDGLVVPDRPRAASVGDGGAVMLLCLGRLYCGVDGGDDAVSWPFVAVVYGDGAVLFLCADVFVIEPGCSCLW